MRNLKVNKMKKRSGFSLVELMVVVAIIGILAVIGIPQYQKFMSKARQAEAKTHLNSIFQGESSFFTEYNQYSTNMNAIGAAAIGQGLRYNAGFITGTCTSYSASPAIGDDNTITFQGASVVPAGTTWFYGAISTPGAGTACDSRTGQSSYTASAWGNPTNTIDTGTGNSKDQFSINHQRAVVHMTIGL